LVRKTTAYKQAIRLLEYPENVMSNVKAINVRSQNSVDNAIACAAKRLAELDYDSRRQVDAKDLEVKS
jgi:hypothetical protein